MLLGTGDSAQFALIAFFGLPVGPVCFGELLLDSLCDSLAHVDKTVAAVANDIELPVKGHLKQVAFYIF